MVKQWVTDQYRNCQVYRWLTRNKVQFELKHTVSSVPSTCFLSLSLLQPNLTSAFFITDQFFHIFRLTATNVRIKFVTNTTKESKRILHERLTRIGFSIQKDEIFTSLTAARQLIDTRCLRPYMLIADAAKEEFSDISSEQPNAVLVGLAPERFDYEHLTTAFRFVATLHLVL